MADSLEKYYPDDEERTAFAEKVKQDLKNPNHHLYCPLYASLVGSANVGMS
jgi:hypothetical protein